VRILAAFDKCKDSLTAREICSLAKQTILEISPSTSVDTLPITDGGEGFAEFLTDHKDGKFHDFWVKDSIGREKKVVIGIIDPSNLDSAVFRLLGLPMNEKIAVIEMSSVVGLSDLKTEERNPWKTSTFGVGQLLAKAAGYGVGGIVLGIGGSSTNDIGLGALSSLGVKLLNDNGQNILLPTPDTWCDINNVLTNELLPLPPIRIACDVSNPLTGKDGATFQFGAQKGLTPEDKDKMEGNIVTMSKSLSLAFNKSLDFQNKPGAGAAGGIGYGLSLAYNVEFIPGFSLVKNWFDLEEKIKQSDIILTGEGRFDKTSLYGKGPYEIIQLASEFEKKIILLAGSVDFEVVSRLHSDFSNLKAVSFSKESLELSENLARAPEFFKEKLRETLFFLK